MSKVSELLALKIENTALRIQQFQALADKQVVEQRALIEAARLEVSAPADHVYNIQTTEFQAP